MTKEFLINEYMKDVDVENLSVSKIKADLQTILHELPGISLEYKTDYTLNEVNKETEKTETLASIKIYFSNINTQGGSDEGGYVEHIF